MKHLPPIALLLLALTGGAALDYQRRESIRGIRDTQVRSCGRVNSLRREVNLLAHALAKVDPSAELRPVPLGNCRKAFK